MTVEFVYRVNGQEIEAYMQDPKTGVVKDPVKLSRDWVNELTQNAMHIFGLDYPTAFDIAVYLAYVKAVWVK